MKSRQILWIYWLVRPWWCWRSTRKSTFKITSWNSTTDLTLPNVKEHAPIARKKSSTVWLNWALFNHNFVMLPKDENKYAQKNLSAIHTNWFSWFIKHFCSISNSTWCYLYVFQINGIFEFKLSYSLEWISLYCLLNGYDHIL